MLIFFLEEYYFMISHKASDRHWNHQSLQRFH